MTLAEINAERSAIKSKLLEISSTGQEYTVVGSHSVKNPTYQVLEARLARLDKQKMRLLGVRTGRTTPNFEG
jgi:hypothetical protein